SVTPQAQRHLPPMTASPQRRICPPVVPLGLDGNAQLPTRPCFSSEKNLSSSGSVRPRRQRAASHEALLLFREEFCRPVVPLGREANPRLQRSLLHFR